jgi:hypothetical protein
VNSESREGLVGQCLALTCMRNLLRILLSNTRGRPASVPPFVDKRCEAPVSPFPNQRCASTLFAPHCTAPCWCDSPTSTALSARSLKGSKAHLLPLVARIQSVRSGTSTSEKDLILSACLLNENAAGRASGNCYGEPMSFAKCRTTTTGYFHSCNISGGRICQDGRE